MSINRLEIVNTLTDTTAIAVIYNFDVRWHDCYSSNVKHFILWHYCYSCTYSNGIK